MHDDVKTTAIIAATIRDGEPRYVLAALDRGVFDHLKIGHRYEVMTEWDGHIEWDGRDIIIIPDSDVFRRQDLLRAVYALGRELRERGASVSVAEIPQPGSKKVGLDDYLVAGGRVDDLETFTLGGQAFRSASFWYGRWKIKTVTLATAA
jgi:hypothetical protein